MTNEASSVHQALVLDYGTEQYVVSVGDLVTFEVPQSRPFGLDLAARLKTDRVERGARIVVRGRSGRRCSIDSGARLAVRAIDAEAFYLLPGLIRDRCASWVRGLVLLDGKPVVWLDLRGIDEVEE